MKQQMTTNNEQVLPTSFTNSTVHTSWNIEKGGGERGWEQGFHESIFVEHVVLVFQNLTLLQSILCSIIDAMLVTFRKM